MRERATDEALKAIAEPRRRAILRLVADEELAAGEIAAAFDVTRTAVSQHLTVLKNAGLLTERRDGTRRLYRTRPAGLDGLREFLNEMWGGPPAPPREVPRMTNPPQLATYQLALLRRSKQYGEFDDASRERIFGEHLAYTLSMVRSGQQLAAGPVKDSPDEEEDICGLGLYQKDSLDEVRELLVNDPGVRQGLYRFDVMTWLSAPGIITPPPGWGTA